MTRMTQEQRAKRRTTRKNNKLKKTHPLFADQFAVTEEESLDFIQRHDTNFEAWLKEKERLNRELEEEAQKARADIAEIVSVHDLEILTHWRLGTYPLSAEYSASFWNQMRDDPVRRLDTIEAYIVYTGIFPPCVCGGLIRDRGIVPRVCASCGKDEKQNVCTTKET